MATVFFSIIVSTHFQNDLHACKINSSDILFHSSSIAIVGLEVAFVFSKIYIYIWTCIKWNSQFFYMHIK